MDGGRSVGITLGGTATSIQTAASDAAEKGVNIVSAMTTTWHAAIALSEALGALLLNLSGPAGLFWAMAALIAASLVTVVTARAHGFRPGSRAER